MAAVAGQCDGIARAQRRAGDEMNVAVGEGAAKTRRAPVGREMDGDAARGQAPRASASAGNK